MAYDSDLAARVRELLADANGVTEKKMFGGIGWMIGGNMAVGAHTDGRLLVRCAADDSDRLAAEPGADLMKRGSTRMRGWILVDGDAVATDEALAPWVARGRAHAESLPKKP
jgi:TfoX/Sxy family transcriptional regulator of competence genes